MLIFRWTDVYDLLEEMKTNGASSTHQVIVFLIKWGYDDSSNWRMVNYALGNSTTKRLWLVYDSLMLSSMCLSALVVWSEGLSY